MNENTKDEQSAKEISINSVYTKTRMMDKDKWIEAVLQSADGMSRAEAPDMLTRMEARIGGRRIELTISTTSLWAIAASVALLVALNITTILHTAPARYEGGDMMALMGLDKASVQTDIGAIFLGSEGVSND